MVKTEDELKDIVRKYVHEVQKVTSALAEKISAFLAENYLKERASRGSHKLFLKALKKVKDKAPNRDDDI